MLIRALIVLLVVLNLGAAAWWLTRPDPQPAPPPELPAGVARLQLVDEEAAPAPARPSSPAADTPPRAPAVCFSLGPFTSEAAADQARNALGEALLRVQMREAPGASASGYQVVMPPAASLEEAQAIAARIGAAGIEDFLVVRQGEQANSIALGRYRSRDAADRRLADLQARGFTAHLQPVGGAGPSLWWLDAGAAEDADPNALARRASIGAPQPLECTALR